MNKIKYTLVALAFLFSSIACNAQNERTVLSFTINPIETLAELADIKITPKSGSASSYQSGEEIAKAFDGDMSTIYHSSWGSTTFPVTLQFNLPENSDVDYLIYHPRTSGHNGLFKEAEILYKLASGDEVSYKTIDFGGSNSATKVSFPSTLTNVEYVKFVVKSGAGDGKGFASCAEMEFFQYNKGGVDLSAYFVDDLYSDVKPGVTLEDVMASEMPLFFKVLAKEQLEGTYPQTRIREYEAYRPYGDLQKELKTSTYNQYENPAGIFAEAGKQMAVFVADTKDESITMTIRDWNTNEQTTYALSTGINFITPSMGGNVYVNYYTKNYATASPIKIHFYGGKDNGIFFGDGGSTNEDWKSLLANASSDYIDMVGKYVNLAYYVPKLKTVCPNNGVELIDIYDEIIEHQYELMGLFVYDRVPKNHMFGRNTLEGFMSAGGIGANFQYGTLDAIGNKDVIVKGGNSWGIAHEFGHVNQVRPGLRWVGTVECTNNVYSSYTQYMFQKKYSTFDLRLEHENCRAMEGGINVIGGRFNAHLNNGVLKGENWLYQWGPDGGSDHFVKLVPIWQLNLYFKIADTEWRKENWYADICEAVRTQDDTGLTNGDHQINFIKRACQYTQTDLTEFFEKAGMLKPINKIIDDYGESSLVITEEMCQSVKDYVAENPTWKKPAGVINYISGMTVGMYETKAAVTGTLNQGVTVNTDGTVTVNHANWKNAVVYETYAGDELVRITMAGTGVKDNSSTKVFYPAGSNKIVAVAWDGTKTTVYQP
ncbi:hypothetical protein M2138_001599, partial [Dysgonomonadaceae bacterium PH5-43]|nr:hypothetical protein [Dysgonomonadaceae bacterium PH5-43]